MEFLVHIEVRWPAGRDPDEYAQLSAAERGRALELATSGELKRLWRVPGRKANWGLWEASDATDLHAALMTLPFSEYLDIEVYPLARHPNDPVHGNPE